MTNMRDSEKLNGKKHTIEMATLELQLLQDVVGRQEDYRLRVRGWNLALIAALLVARSSDELTLGRWTFAILAMGIVASGWVLEAWHNLAEYATIRRARKVEHFLQSPDARQYDGPLIGGSLLGSGSAAGLARELISGVLYPRILLPHLIMSATVISVAYLS